MTDIQAALATSLSLIEEELEVQRLAAAELGGMLKLAVALHLSDKPDEAKAAAKLALDFEYNWLLSCEISARVADLIGLDEE